MIILSPRARLSFVTWIILRVAPQHRLAEAAEAEAPGGTQGDPGSIDESSLVGGPLRPQLQAASSSAAAGLFLPGIVKRNISDGTGDPRAESPQSTPSSAVTSSPTPGRGSAPQTESGPTNLTDATSPKPQTASSSAATGLFLPGIPKRSIDRWAGVPSGGTESPLAVSPVSRRAFRELRSPSPSPIRQPSIRGRRPPAPIRSLARSSGGSSSAESPQATSSSSSSPSSAASRPPITQRRSSSPFRPGGSRPLLNSKRQQPPNVDTGNHTTASSASQPESGPANSPAVAAVKPSLPPGRDAADEEDEEKERYKGL